MSNCGMEIQRLRGGFRMNEKIEENNSQMQSEKKKPDEID